MNKVIFGIIALVIIALGAGVFVASGSDDEAAVTTPSNSSASAPVSSGAKEEIVAQSSGASDIQTYSAEAVAASTTESNLVFFHAAWCSVCNSVERNINAGSIPDNLSIFKVDYDSEEGQALAKKYSIPAQFAMVQVDTSGNEITKWLNQFNDGVNEIVANLETI